MSSRKPLQELEKYKVIGQASRQVYEALGKACTKHTEHQAHICVEVEQAVINGDDSAQVKFNMAYTHLTLAGSADQGDLIWFVVDSISGDAVKMGQSDTAIGLQNSFTHSLKRQIESSSGATQQKFKKSVRFQSPVQVPLCRGALPTPIIANAVLFNDSVREIFAISYEGIFVILFSRASVWAYWTTRTAAGTLCTHHQINVANNAGRLSRLGRLLRIKRSKKLWAALRFTNVYA